MEAPPNVACRSPALPFRSRASGPLTLADGATANLSRLSYDELLRLQWQQERQFARQILSAPKGSVARTEAMLRANDTVTRILAAKRGLADQPMAMGLRPRTERLVLEVLARQRRRGVGPSLLEIGFGSGLLLRRVRDAGYPFAGIEASEAMHEQACRLLGSEYRPRLHLGDFLGYEFPPSQRRFSLVYWNDVFEHIPPDETPDYLRRIHEFLVPGGQLLTITPNWHVRPSDVTRMMLPPRTEAVGLHLKEYTLREMVGLLRRAGFARVATPLGVLPRRMVLCGRGLIGLKCLAEPALEWLPFRLARLLCGALALSTTIATKGQ